MVNFSNLARRPGVQVKTSISDLIPTPLANHAIAYMFVSVPGDVWDSSPENYTALSPSVPTIVTSLSDYLSKIGGKVPNPATNYEAYISYRSVETFFKNSGGAGVLYVIRVVVTAQTILTLDPLVSSTSRYFVVKIDGVYYGTVDLGNNDQTGTRRYALQTTGLDLADNTYDIKAFLESNSLFNNSYTIENDPTLITSGVLKISSKVSKQVPDVQVFNTTDSTGLLANLVSAGTIVQNTNKREINLRLSTAQYVFPIDAQVFRDEYYAVLNNTGVFDNFPAVGDAITNTQRAALINKYLIDKFNLPIGLTQTGSYKSIALPVTSGYGTVPYLADENDYYVAIYDKAGNNLAAVTETSGGTPATRDVNTKLTFYRASLSPSATPGLRDLINWGAVSFPVFDPKSFNSFSLNVGSPTNRFVLTSNGATVADHAISLLPSLNTAIADDNFIVNIQTAVTRGYQTVPGVQNSVSTVIPYLVYGANTSAPLYSWDTVASFSVESRNSEPVYIWQGSNTQNVVETNLFNFLSSVSPSGTSAPRLYDYTETILNSLNSNSYLPGFVLCPEAYASYSTAHNINSSIQLRSYRLSITTALQSLAKTKNWFALVDDNPDSLSAQDSAIEFNTITNTVPSSGGHYGFFYPFLYDNQNILLPMSPAVAGIACARYLNEGFVQPPAGIKYPLLGFSKPKFNVNEPQLEIYSPRGMNAAITVPNSGVVLFGSRTTAVDSPIQFINSRIISNIALRSLSTSFDGFVFNALQTNNQVTFNSIRNTAVGIMQNLYDSGALFGKTAKDAYTVEVESVNQDDSALNQGVVFVYVEFAPVGTIERLVLSISITGSGQIDAQITNLG